MLTLYDYPNFENADLGGAPHAADESNIDYLQQMPGYPMFVRWRAHDDRSGSDVLVLIGFPTIKADAINAVLKRDRSGDRGRGQRRAQGR